MSTQALEYGLLAGLLALVALALGLTAAWYVITQIFSFNWLPVLAARPARALRKL